MQFITLKNSIEKIIVCFLISISALSFAQQKPLNLALDTINKKDLSVKFKAGEYHILTKGNTPFIFTEPLKSERAQENVALSFEYFCPKGLDFFKIQFGKNGNIKTITSIGVAEGWVTYSIDLTDDLKNWGKTGDQLRFDLGSNANVEIQIRNLKLRKPTDREKEIAANREQKQKSEAAMDINLKKYLSANYGAQITDVNVSEKDITISGKTPQITNIFLAEVKPYDDVTEMTVFKNCIPIKKNLLHLKFQGLRTKMVSIMIDYCLNGS